MKIVGIIGSPRKTGSTAALVRAALEGARETGASTELYYLGDLDVGGCLGCEVCKDTGECAQGDDMHLLYRALDDCQGIVLGSPIYLDHITAQTKAWLDRLYAYLGSDLQSRFPTDVRAVVCLTWEAPNPAAYTDVAHWLEGRLEYYFNIHTIATLTAEATDTRPAALRQDLLARSREAGARLAAPDPS